MVHDLSSPTVTLMILYLTDHEENYIAIVQKGISQFSIFKMTKTGTAAETIYSIPIHGIKSGYVNSPYDSNSLKYIMALLPYGYMKVENRRYRDLMSAIKITETDRVTMHRCIYRV